MQSRENYHQLGLQVFRFCAIGQQVGESLFLGERFLILHLGEAINIYGGVLAKDRLIYSFAI